MSGFVKKVIYGGMALAGIYYFPEAYAFYMKNKTKIDNTKEKIGEVAGDLKEKAERVAENAKDKAAQTAKNAKETLNNVDKEDVK